MMKMLVHKARKEKFLEYPMQKVMTQHSKSIYKRMDLMTWQDHHRVMATKGLKVRKKPQNRRTSS